MDSGYTHIFQVESFSMCKKIQNCASYGKTLQLFLILLLELVHIHAFIVPHIGITRGGQGMISPNIF